VGVRYLVAVHARDVEAARIAGGIQHGVVAGPLGTEAEVVAHQHIARAQAVDQHVLDELLGRLRGQPAVEGQHDGLGHAAGREFAELVAQRADACRRQVGFLGEGGEIVARMGLEREHAARQPALASLGLQEREHGLVATVHAVEIPYREGAGRGYARVPEATENLHR
jgi:hypothetical protein